MLPVPDGTAVMFHSAILPSAESISAEADSRSEIDANCHDGVPHGGNFITPMVSTLRVDLTVPGGTVVRSDRPVSP
jgi:hypothetical protein